MKRFFYLMMVALVWTACQTSESAQTEQVDETAAEAVVEVEKMTFPADSLSPDGTSFHGLRIDATDAMPVADLQAAVNETGSLDVKISGPIEAACQAKGCWMNITSEQANAEEMMVKFKDYGFFVPKDIAGRQVIMQGKAYREVTPVDELQHLAEDAGKSAEEIAAITEPKVELKFMADGVKLLSE